MYDVPNSHSIEIPFNLTSSAKISLHCNLLLPLLEWNYILSSSMNNNNKLVNYWVLCYEMKNITFLTVFELENKK